MTFCFDIDNTILITEYKNGTYLIKHVNSYILRVIKKLREEGHQIILYTGRHWNHLKLTKDQIKETGIEYDTLILGKPVADFYIDDLSVRPEEVHKFLKNVLEEKDGK
jgi:hydroxymethylpyrimidine pyrophosphatase-like HAD family hydrolase